MTIRLVANTTYRNLEAPGSSVEHEPVKAEIRSLFALIDGTLSSLVDGLVIGDAVMYATRAALYADLDHVAGVLGVVYNDGDLSGIYVKAGATGAGSWSLTDLSLPAEFAAELQSVVDDLAAQSIQIDALTSGLAAEVARTEFVTSIISESALDLAEFSVDPYGLIFSRTTTGGVVETESQTVETLTVSSVTMGDAVESLSENDRFASFSTDGYGLIFDAVEVAASPVVPPAATKPRRYPYDVIGVVVGGQSLSRGLKAVPALSTTQAYQNLMLSSGLRTEFNSPYTSDTLVPLVEETDNSPPEGDPVGETPTSGMLDMWNALVEADGDPDAPQFQLFALNPGVSGTLLSYRIKGGASGTYTRHLAAVQQAYDLCQADGKSFAMMVAVEIGGENESDAGTDAATYSAMLAQYRLDLDTDYKAITGQTENLQLLISQVASHSVLNSGSSYRADIARAQYALARSDANIHLPITPYIFPFNADGVHLQNTSSRSLGEYMGFAAWSLVTAGEPVDELYAVDKVVQGNILTVRFNQEIVLDRSWVQDPGNCGVEVFSGAGVAATVTAVSATAERLKITVSSMPASPYVDIGVAFTDGAASGPTTGARTCIRSRGKVRGRRGNPLYVPCPIMRI